ncbi:MAG: hypothetical protein A3J65_04460 [Candidatus Buchananbacteria bacterium RIFCSPHIGHO2_02_FULL_45_11b]|uniref:Radical SAM core domain-containing protein n=1 Tax=Candidatus Buchananbacteria bacterium RIFCSPHIGHO2_02_FULL_45_11b TaxID=1797541 RepID=A0A1G1YDF7_9BACT|nr:MAG: hypothetical protein A3J65_04460 [Candidatus Buchananbacteria bacterium RIFCSPHIGHO2_02_FULL_45_11b]
MADNKTTIFDFFNYRILSFYNEIKLLKAGKMPPPRMAILHLTSGCNHNCEGCDYRIQNKVKKILTPEQNDYIISQLIEAGVEAVEFAGGGEPLIDPYVPAMLYKLKAHGLATDVLTNGGLMFGKTLEAIIDCCSFIRISLEAGSNEIFQKVKQIDNPKEFPKIINNIREAIRLKKEKNKTLNINIKFTVGKKNYQDMENAIQLAASLGVDSIQFKLYENAPGVQLTPGEAAAVAVKLKKLKDKYQGEVRIIGNLIKTAIYHQCWLCSFYTVIDVWGNIYLCSYYHHRPDAHKIGNIFEKSFKEIWGSEKHWTAIKNIDIKKCNLYDCRFHFYNAFWDKIIDENSDDLKFI